MAALTLPPPVRRRPCWSLTAVLLALPALALLPAGARPWGLGTPWIQLLSALPYFTAPLLLAVLMSLRSRGRAAAAVSAVLTLALLIQLGLLAPRLFPSGPRAGTTHALTVMSLNIGSGTADVDRIVRLVKETKVEVLALVELDPDMAADLDRAGLSAQLPYKALDVDWVGTGAGIYSRYPLTNIGRVPGSAFYESRAAVAVPWSRSPVWVTAVHTASPRPGHTASWRRDLHTLAGSAHGGDPVVLLGDFNASLDHSEFREVLAAGFTDAASSLGRSLQPTWPEASPLPPFVTLDHVLTNNTLAAGDYRTLAVDGTDHAAVWAALYAPRAGGQ